MVTFPAVLNDLPVPVVSTITVLTEREPSAPLWNKKIVRDKQQLVRLESKIDENARIEILNIHANRSIGSRGHCCRRSDLGEICIATRFTRSGLLDITTSRSACYTKHRGDGSVGMNLNAHGEDGENGNEESLGEHYVLIEGFMERE